jgi:hypothetical protein
MRGVISIDSPGERFGPCRNEHCEHQYCSILREWANSICSICGKPIGFNDKFLLESFQHERCQTPEILIDADEIPLAQEPGSTKAQSELMNQAFEQKLSDAIRGVKK